VATAQQRLYGTASFSKFASKFFSGKYSRGEEGTNFGDWSKIKQAHIASLIGDSVRGRMRSSAFGLAQE